VPRLKGSLTSANRISGMQQKHLTLKFRMRDEYPSTAESESAIGKCPEKGDGQLVKGNSLIYV